MSWHTPSFAGTARSAVRISARVKDAETGQTVVQLWLSAPAMKAMNAGIGDRLKLLVGAAGNLGWFRLQPAMGETVAVVRIASAHGKRSASTGLVSFSKAYLADVASPAVLSAMDADHRFDGPAIEVRVPVAWLDRTSDADTKRNSVAAEAVPAPVEIEPETAGSLAESVVPNCETAGNYAEAIQPSAGGGGAGAARVRWSSTKKAKLRAMWKDKATDAQLIAAFPGHSFAAIKAKATSMGLGFRAGVELMGRPARTATYVPPAAEKTAPAAPAPIRHPPGPWSDGELAELRRLWRLGAGNTHLETAFPGRTLAAIRQKASQLNLGLRPVADERGPEEAAPPRAAVAAPAANPMPPAPEERRLPARRPAGDPPPVESGLDLAAALAEPIGFLRDAGVKIAESPIARGTWFVDGEAMTARQIVQQANILCRKGGMAERFRFEDATDRVMAAAGGSSASPLASAGAG